MSDNVEGVSALVRHVYAKGHIEGAVNIPYGEVGDNLDKLPQGLFTFCALPLRYENADGSPIRAIALLED